MTGNDPLHPAFTLAVMLAATLMFLGVDLALHESVAVIFKEGHTIELMSAVFLAFAAGLWWVTGADDMRGRQWHIPAILTLMTLRELDFDKRFTSEGVLQLRLYSGPSPLWEKLLGLAVIALILICGWRLLTITMPRWWAGLRAGLPTSWLAGLAALLVVVAKSLDGLDRKLADFGVILAPEYGTLAGRAEELLELAAFMMLVQALVYFLRCRRITAIRLVPAPYAAFLPHWR